MGTGRVGPAGKFGSRYGKRIRDVYSRIRRMQHERYECPKCMEKGVRRVAAGIWQCSKCGAKFAGGAFTFKSGLIEKGVESVQVREL